MSAPDRNAALLDAPAAPLRGGVVLFGNTLEQVARLLGALLRAAAEPGAPAVALRVLDHSDHSAGEGLAAAFEEQGLGRLYSRAENRGFAAGHNRLLADAFAAPETRAYLCLNPDAIAHPGLFVELWRALQATPDAALQPALIEALQFPDEHPKPYDPQTGATPWCSGCALLLTRKLYETIGGFDERYFVFCEDVDLSWRARAAGLHVRMTPRALVHHYVGGRRFDRQREIMLQRSAALLAARFGHAGFARGQAAAMRRLGATPAPLRIEKPAPALAAVADLDHGYSFTVPRWGAPIGMGEHPPLARLDDELVTVVLRCENASLEELDGALFALAAAAPPRLHICASGPPRLEVEALLRRHQPLGGYEFSLSGAAAPRGRLVAFHAAGERVFPGHFEALAAALQQEKAAWAVARSRAAELQPGDYVATKRDLGPLVLSRAALLLGELPPACAALYDSTKFPAGTFAQDDALLLLKLAASVPCALVAGPPSCERRAQQGEVRSAAELEVRKSLVAQFSLDELRAFAEALAAKQQAEASPLPLRYRLADSMNGALKAGLGPLQKWLRALGGRMLGG